MKIGKFAENNGITIDTVRHYMDFGLIVPEKRGGQYFFDSKCQKDIEDVISLKNMGFTLNEVKKIFLFKGFGSFTSYQENEYYRGLYINKHENILKQIIELESYKNNLEKKLGELSENSTNKNYTMGIELRALGLLKCIRCGRELTLESGTISSNAIVHGRLVCGCGENYPIEDGILFSEGYKAKEISEGNGIASIAEYINETNADYLQQLYVGLEWCHRKIDFNMLQNKIILELGTGSGFFLRHIYGDLPENCIYIAVDHDIARHKFLKHMLERANCKRNILFICSDFLKMPLKYNIADVIYDISGSSNYGFEHENFLLRLMEKYMKENSYLLGSYILFQNFSANGLIPSVNRRNFIEKNVKEALKDLKYNKIDDMMSGYLEKGGAYESYFVDGEKVYSYMFYGNRNI